MIVVRIDNRTVRKNINLHNLFLDGHRVVKMSVAVDALLKSRYHVVRNLPLCLYASREDAGLSLWSPAFHSALFASHFPILYWKYRVISEPIHFPTGTETPFPIIR